jgi:hypothetical protein
MKRGDFLEIASLLLTVQQKFYSKQGEGWVLLARFPQKAELLLSRPVNSSSVESMYI